MARERRLSFSQAQGPQVIMQPFGRCTGNADGLSFPCLGSRDLLMPHEPAGTSQSALHSGLSCQVGMVIELPQVISIIAFWRLPPQVTPMSGGPKAADFKAMRFSDAQVGPSSSCLKGS